MRLKTDGEAREQKGKWIEYAGQRRSTKSLARSKRAVEVGWQISLTGIGNDGGG